jgi:hypothetical protein
MKQGGESTENHKGNINTSLQVRKPDLALFLKNSQDVKGMASFVRSRPSYQGMN